MFSATSKLINATPIIVTGTQQTISFLKDTIFQLWVNSKTGALSNLSISYLNPSNQVIKTSTYSGFIFIKAGYKLRLTSAGGSVLNCSYVVLEL